MGVFKGDSEVSLRTLRNAEVDDFLAVVMPLRGDDWGKCKSLIVKVTKREATKGANGSVDLTCTEVCTHNCYFLSTAALEPGMEIRFVSKGVNSRTSKKDEDSAPVKLGPNGKRLITVKRYRDSQAQKADAEKTAK